MQQPSAFRPAIALLAFALGVATVSSLRAATIPPAGKPIPAGDRARLEEGVAQLGNVIRHLEKELADKPDLLALLPDVRIYHKAVDWPLRFNEPLDVKNADAALTRGIERARQLRQGQAPWLAAGGVRAYVSKIDGSVQPYVVAPPKGYARKANDSAKYRLDFFFHGRSETLTELAFISGKAPEAPTAPPDENRFVVYPYGRYCNANKFAGEIDTLEVLARMKREYPIDENRVLVTGFSMGGAACWHIAVHYADLWAAASPGAGFAETRQYQKMDRKDEWAQLPWYQKKLMHLYDAPDYALNLSMLPLVAYAGENDPQQQSGDVMGRAMEQLGLKLERVYGPNTAHKYEKRAKQDLAARLDAYAAKGRNTVPKEVRFETWTLRYNHMHWLSLDGLERHWERARVQAKIAGPDAVNVTTTNVGALSLDLPATAETIAPDSTVKVTIDGVAVPVKSTAKGLRAAFAKAGGGWQLRAQDSGSGAGDLKKRPGLQGPVDDAFLDAFLIVKPTGKPLNDAVGKWTAAELRYATEEWRKIFRGDAPVRNDTELTDTDIRDNNLILFGDPSSNATLAKIADKLPVRWTKEGIAVGDKTYPADRHALITIYPNPLNPGKYVVLNSGFTFRQADHRTNSRQIAKLPDYAVVDLTTPPNDKAPGAIPWAGFYDEAWRLQEDDGNRGE